MKILAAIFVVFLAFQASECKIFSKCELVRTLEKYGNPFSRNLLADWNCLVRSESSYNTRARGPRNSDGSYDWGLFQINDRYWCRVGQRGGDCNIDCNKLVDDDISDDVACVKLIYKRHGFGAWYGWVNSCRGGKEGINECF